MLWMSLGGILWIVALGLVIWALVRWLGHRTPMNSLPPERELSALEILRQRYARGEIDATTYEQMRERLESAQEPVTTGDYRGPGGDNRG
ncbi:MAG TPA: SHOCT domain-containing protein [Ktedonobacterales bacterium]|nr:SHOCT domain-containing protein [Ktedonobacterales bacterium]